jgi:hypothetical protein
MQEMLLPHVDFDLSKIRIQSGEEADRMTRSLGARVVSPIKNDALI